jgi:DNA-binding NarL/FixJ family response regulator
MSTEIHSIKRGHAVVSLLLVEDNPADVALFEELLELIQDFKFVSYHVTSLRSAIDSVSGDKFDCIVLDLNLPDSQGLQTYKDMRKHALATAIVILSGEAERETMLHALRAGADNYLIKGSSDGNRIAIAILSAMRNYSEAKKRTEYVVSEDIDNLA